MDLQAFMQSLQDGGFATMIRESALAYPVILSTHLAGMGLFGGMIAMTDLRILGVAMTSRPMADVHNQLRPYKHLGLTTRCALRRDSSLVEGRHLLAESVLQDEARVPGAGGSACVGVPRAGVQEPRRDGQDGQGHRTRKDRCGDFVVLVGEPGRRWPLDRLLGAAGTRVVKLFGITFRRMCIPITTLTPNSAAPVTTCAVAAARITPGCGGIDRTVNTASPRNTCTNVTTINVRPAPASVLCSLHCCKTNDPTIRINIDTSIAPITCGISPSRRCRNAAPSAT